ncbi:alpha/beta fold hydrolase [Mycolicibacter senuensis]|uniref:Non-heme haloperoxidase Hpx n=1 Tax=Mycolicibacter senuensis TaxID=386913 RepID=A0A7I9XFH9_9MYCO|nr:alpha/beta hydrolase [Mycolicibacter senuensis]MDQ2626606.1 alpha/beta hydrolase [Actinomycetota bacterium]ORW65204.1 haloperoxidase [Mycolicibacter senuensis]GFG68723.1 non-heme haloperoxidase Hpx [Mycolicibacter senuensis]
MAVRAADGTKLHTQVFGPADGYPVVLAHGITCAIRVWGNQIAELANDYRVIAYDHRGHGSSGVPKRGGYTLTHLASDLDSVLEATLAPGERAVIAGHSMGGIAISAWSDRYRHRVEERADAVALINTTTGNLLAEVDLFSVAPPLQRARVQAARRALLTFGSVPIVGPANLAVRRFVHMLAVGGEADPVVTSLICDLFARTPPAGRGHWVRTLVDSLGPSSYLNLDGLTVPTLVIGSTRDRLLPMVASRRIADIAPNLARFVEVGGGHCSILEHPTVVNRELRELVELVTGSAAGMTADQGIIS